MRRPNTTPEPSSLRLQDIKSDDLHLTLEHLGSLLEQINRRIPQLLEYYVAPWQLSVLAWNALSCLRNAGGETTLSVIGAEIDASPSTMTGIASRLERAGYVQRAVSTRDRRATVLICTDRGRKVLDSITDQFYGDLIHVASDVDASEVDAIVSAFTRIVTVLDALTVKQSATSQRESNEK